MTAQVISLPTQRAAAAAPDINVKAYVGMILEAANSLLREKLVIVGFHADVFSVFPALWVIDCPYVRNLARVGIASYPRNGTDHSGPYKIGEFERCGVTVSWIERVPS